MPMHTDTLATLRRITTETHGFLRADDLRTLAADPDTRLTPVLVRCGGCRFTCPAQDAAHLIDIITRERSDYVRDVSLPVKDNG